MEHLVNASNVKPLHERFQEAVFRSRIRHSHLEDSMKQIKSHKEGSAAAISSPVSSGNGDYLMEISVGTPAQKFTVVMDTGSDLCWVQCLPCTNCFEQKGHQFDPTKSTTYKNSGCSDSMCKVSNSVKDLHLFFLFFFSFEISDRWRSSIGLFSLLNVSMQLFKNLQNWAWIFACQYSCFPLLFRHEQLSLVQSSQVCTFFQSLVFLSFLPFFCSIPFWHGKGVLLLMK